jgi:hypothetical protein
MKAYRCAWQDEQAEDEADEADNLIEYEDGSNASEHAGYCVICHVVSSSKWQ